jgi:hypothetical protein
MKKSQAALAFLAALLLFTGCMSEHKAWVLSKGAQEDGKPFKVQIVNEGEVK